MRTSLPVPQADPGKAVPRKMAWEGQGEVAQGGGREGGPMDRPAQGRG